MSDALQEPEPPLTQPETHDSGDDQHVASAGYLEHTEDLHEANEGAKEDDTPHNFTSTASESAFEFHESAPAYPVNPPSTTHSQSIPTGDLLGDNDASAFEVPQDPGAPHLPPRPADEHPAWTHSPPPDSQSMNRNTTAPGVVRSEEHPDPAVAQLKSMFPDFDDVVLQSVLESVNGSQDAAVDILLGMSDPSYVSTHQPAPPPPSNPTNPSLELDEQLARQLMLEDQREQQSGRGRWRPSSQSWPRRGSRSQPPGEQQVQQGQQDPQGQQGQGGDRVQEIKETFNQIAESGKRTFSSIVTRVRAKINEYDQSRNQPQQPPNPAWESGSASQSPEFNYSQQSGPYAAYNAPGAAQDARASVPPMDRHATSQAYAQYYAVGSDEDDGWTPIGHRGRQSQDGGQGQREGVKGYDIDDSPEMPATASPAPIPPTNFASSYAPPSSSPPVPAPVTEAPVPRPPPTVAGSPINAAKLGLLPRRPVNLMSSQPTTPTPRRNTYNDDDDDELDYVENPFEEGRK